MKRLSMLLTLSLIAAACAASCADERPPVDRVQPYALAKVDFVGADLADPSDDPEFWTQASIIDVGYGASDQTTLGEITEDVIADNTSRWSGNHLMDPAVVPGIVLANRPITGVEHGLPDVTATILAWYGVPLSEGMSGKSIF